MLLNVGRLLSRPALATGAAVPNNLDSAADRRSAAQVPFLPLTATPTPSAGKALAWRQQVAQGYSGIATAAIVTLAITLSALGTPLVQRAAASTSVAMVFAGTYFGDAPNAIQGRVLLSADNSVVVDWTPVLSYSAGAGAWSGHISVPQGGPYYRQARVTAAVLTTGQDATQVSVGAWIHVGGQSNANNLIARTGGSPPAASSGTFWCDDTNSNAIGAVINTIGARKLANGLRSLLGVPVGIFRSAKDGAAINELMDGDVAGWFQSFYVPRLAAIGGDCELTLFIQGESDTGQTEALDTPADVWRSRRATLHASYAAQSGRTIAQQPFIMAGIGTYGGAFALSSDWGWSRIRDAIRDGHDPSAHVYFSHTMVDLTRIDNLHYDAASYGLCADRFVQTAGYVYGAQAHTASWLVTAAAENGATGTLVTLAQGLGTDFTPSSGITGFEVSDNNGATWTTATGARSSATQIALTHASLGLTRLVRYMGGLLPTISSAVFDNSALTLPLVPAATGIPASTATPNPRSVHLGCLPIANATATVTTSSIYIGPAATDRYIVGAIADDGAAKTLNSGTINPTGQTPVAITVRHQRAQNGLILAFFTALVPAGTDATVTLALSAGFTNNGEVFLWSINSAALSSTTPVDAQSATADNTHSTASATLATSAGGLIIVVGVQQTAGRTLSLSGDVAYAQRKVATLGNATATVGDTGSTAANAATSVTVTSLANDAVGIAAISFR